MINNKHYQPTIKIIIIIKSKNGVEVIEVSKIHHTWEAVKNSRSNWGRRRVAEACWPWLSCCRLGLLRHGVNSAIIEEWRRRPWVFWVSAWLGNVWVGLPCIGLMRKDLGKNRGRPGAGPWSSGPDRIDQKVYKLVCSIVKMIIKFWVWPAQAVVSLG